MHDITFIVGLIKPRYVTTSFYFLFNLKFSILFWKYFVFLQPPIYYTCYDEGYNSRISH